MGFIGTEGGQYSKLDIKEGRQDDSKQVRITLESATGQENRGHYLVYLYWRPWGVYSLFPVQPGELVSANLLWNSQIFLDKKFYK